MLKNYIKIAIRSLVRNKTFSLINIIGLSVGISAVFLIYRYIYFEQNYDQFHANVERIYRLSSDIKTTDELVRSDKSSALMGPDLMAKFPAIENFTRISPHSILVRSGDKKFQEENTLFADPSFFSVFSFHLVNGNENTALNDALNVVFTESSAKKYFGNENPIGKPILLGGGGHHAIVTGIVKDFPENSHIKAGMLLSMATKEIFSRGIMEEPFVMNWNTYLLLKKGTNAKDLQIRISNYFKEKYSEKMAENHLQISLQLEPLKDLYLHSDRRSLDSYRFAHGTLSNITIFSSIALFILIIACVNFINLSTSRSTERAREVGIRKVTGATRRELIVQFLIESILISLLAGLFSVILLIFVVPFFNQLAGKIVFQDVFEYKIQVAWLFLASFVIGLLAGIYPSLVLSGFKPISVLKGKFISANSGIFLRKTLVIFQFTVSISLIIATIIVYHQLNYMQTRDLGFNKDQMLILDFHDEFSGSELCKRLKKIPNINSCSISGSIPGYEFYKDKTKTEVENTSGELQSYIMGVYGIDCDFLNQYGIPVIAGRNFSLEHGTDPMQAIILNETATKKLGYTSPGEAIGKRFFQFGNEGKVIGVTKDFHDRSLKNQIEPMCYRLLFNNPGTFISVNVSSKDLPTTINSIKKEWDNVIGHRPFSYFFLDEAFDKQYRSEEQFGKLFFVFTLLAILISSLGLIGLVSYHTIQRTKEIGIRKILGARIYSIVKILSTEYIKLILFAFIIATTVSIFLMNKWLENFAYRVTISWWIFITAGMLAAIVALGSISYFTIKAALANPVKSLRTE